MYKSGHPPGWKKAKHRPSGIIVVWLGNDNRIHSKSIGIVTQCPNLVKKFVELDTHTEILLKQLDYIGESIKSMPMMTRGLSRMEAKQALCKELASFSRLTLLKKVTANG